MHISSIYDTVHSAYACVRMPLSLCIYTHTDTHTYRHTRSTCITYKRDMSVWYTIYSGWYVSQIHLQICTHARCTWTYSCTSMPVPCLWVRHRRRSTAASLPCAPARCCLHNAAPTTLGVVGRCPVEARTRICLCPAQMPPPPLLFPFPAPAPTTCPHPSHPSLHTTLTCLSRAPALLVASISSAAAASFFSRHASIKLVISSYMCVYACMSAWCVCMYAWVRASIFERHPHTHINMYANMCLHHMYDMYITCI